MHCGWRQTLGNILIASQYTFKIQAKRIILYLFLRSGSSLIFSASLFALTHCSALLLMSSNWRPGMTNKLRATVVMASWWNLALRWQSTSKSYFLDSWIYHTRSDFQIDIVTRKLTSMYAVCLTYFNKLHKTWREDPSVLHVKDCLDYKSIISNTAYQCFPCVHSEQ